VTSAAFDAAAAASQVVAALLPQADIERAGQAKRYLKSDLDFLGVSVPAIRSAVRDVARTRRELDRDGALAWARALWREPVHEQRTAAIEVLRWYTRRLLPADRSALLTLLPGIRREGLDHERFERYATPMLAEKEFFSPRPSDVRRDVPGGCPQAAR
jgi:hypothetical protein